MLVLVKYGLVFVVGFAMGALRHLKDYSRFRNNLPKEDRKISYLALFVTASYGAVASLIAVLITNPGELEKVFLLSILAGYLGESFVESTANRTLDKANKSSGVDISLQEDLDEEVKKEDGI